MKKILVSALSVAFALSGVTTVYAETTPVTATGTQRVSVVGEEWGAGVNKTILTLDKEISGDSVSAEDFVVVENKDGTETERTIVDAYVSDVNGNEKTSWWGTVTSKYVTLELGISPTEGNPITWSMQTWRNTWPESYKLNVTLAEGADLIAGEETVNAITIEAEVDVDNEETQVYEQLENVTIDSYSYTAEDGTVVEIPYGFYEPSKDGHKNGIIVWNHGIGEGGTDPKIAMYGNEVTALFGDEFQETMDGCYVLAAQVPNSGKRDANRADAIVELVKELAADNSDIDLNRVYVAGCSAGGGMTLTIMNNHADFFAAAVPICPAGSVDTKVEGLLDLPMWFIHAKNDGTVKYSRTETTLATLEEAGAVEVHTSIFPNVIGTYTDAEGNKAEYDGHWSWVYFFNNECVDKDGLNCWEWLSQQTKAIEVAGTQKVVVVGEEWGAGVTKTIINLEDRVIDADSISVDDFEVVENNNGTVTTRTIKAVYASDENGNKVDGNSKYITIEMAISPKEGNPIVWDGNAWRNNFGNYKLYIELTDGAKLVTGEEIIDSINVLAKIAVDDVQKTLYPQMENVVTDTYTYTTDEGKEVVVPYGFYTPEEDDHKNGIIIWNHGIGEGGTDPKIAMYGNEVTSLFGEEFQDVMDGCYVLVAQVPGNGSRDADRATAIVELVKKLATENPDIDLDRVYVAGCSAGGGMTSTIVNNYADFFAAAVPICPAGTIDVEAVGDLPLWYIHAENDSTVRITGTKTNVDALKEAGKEVHTSIFPNVVGTYTYEDGTKAEYDGHWSWVYFFNNACVDDEDATLNCWEWLAQQTNAEPDTPVVEPDEPDTPVVEPDTPVVEPNGTTIPDINKPVTDNKVDTGDHNAFGVYAVLALAAAGAYIVIRRKETN